MKLQVLLGYKKRGFGQGLYVRPIEPCCGTLADSGTRRHPARWNGFGGKVDPGETPLQAAVRELEVGIISHPSKAIPLISCPRHGL